MGLFGSRSKRSDEVVELGAVRSATVVGILVKGEGGGGERGAGTVVEYALEVEAPQPFTAGVRMVDDPPMAMRLGMPLQVFDLDSQVVIDWEGSGASAPAVSQPVKRAPSDGIADQSYGLDATKSNGVPCTARMAAAALVPEAGGSTRVRLSLYVERHGLSGYETEITMARVPHYASHLCVVGRTLPAWVLPERPDDVAIDWPAAATDEPGLDQPDALIEAEPASEDPDVDVGVDADRDGSEGDEAES